METMALNFLKAILIGLGASIPLGPLGIMCIQKTLSKGRWAGFSVGLGSTVADTFYATIALLSVTFISDFLDRNTDWVMLIGGISLFRKRFRLRQMLIINRISGAVIALIGLASVADGLARLIFHQSLL